MKNSKNLFIVKIWQDKNSVKYFLRIILGTILRPQKSIRKVCDLQTLRDKFRIPYVKIELLFLHLNDLEIDKQAKLSKIFYRTWIAVVARYGGCTFEDKVRNAMMANYSAVIVYNVDSNKVILEEVTAFPMCLICLNRVIFAFYRKRF